MQRAVIRSSGSWACSNCEPTTNSDIGHMISQSLTNPQDLNVNIVDQDNLDPSLQLKSPWSQHAHFGTYTVTVIGEDVKFHAQLGA